MNARHPSRSQYVGGRALEWWCLIGGLALVAAVILLPAQRQLTRATAQLAQLRLIAAEWNRVNLEYRQIDDDLRAAEPGVLEHMAFRHLSLKPVGAELMDQIHDPSRLMVPLIGPVDMSDPGYDFKPNRTVWLTSGLMRLAVGGLGVSCVAWALYRTAMRAGLRS